MPRSATPVARSPHNADAPTQRASGREAAFPREERERLLREWEQRAERADASAQRAEDHARERERQREERAERADRAAAAAASIIDEVPERESARPRRSMQEWDYVMEPPAPKGVPGRQTVTITGHGAEGYIERRGTRAPAAQRHQAIKRYERAGFRPDRVAMWAVMLGVILMLAAAASSHA